MAVERIFAAKGRSRQKTMPLIVSDWDMVEKFLLLSPPARELAQTFWPGPLSIITDVAESISMLARDDQGQAAVRMTPHPVARTLCAQTGAPLVSSSANFSGKEPVCVPQDLDVELVRISGAMIIDAEPWPQGGRPSTLVKISAGRKLKVLREGAVSEKDLIKQGYAIV
jgi:L-threonylcarbamoyladenylate synthase